MTAIPLTCSIALAGWGSAVDGLPYRLRAKARNTVSDSVVPAAILMSWPDSVGDEIGFKDISRAVASFAFSCSGLHSAAGLSLLEFLYQASPAPWGALWAWCTAAATTVYVSPILGETVPVAPFALYLEREVMLCTHIAVHYTGDYYVLTVDRGVFGSEASAHTALETSDRYVYAKNPIVESREVTVYDLDVDADTEAVFWTGLLEQPALRGGELRLSALDQLGLLRGVRLGRDRMTWPGAVVSREAPWPVAIRPPTRAAARGALLADAQHIVVSDGESVYLAAVKPYLSGGGVYDLGQIPGSVAEAYGTTRKLGPVTLRECLVAGDAGHLYEAWCTVRDDAGDLSCHPLDIVACILQSSGTATWPYGGSHAPGDAGDWDWLGRTWGLGITDARLDWAAIHALRELGLYRDLRCPSFIVAAPELPSVADLLQRLLAPLMCFPAMTPGGKLTIRSLLDYQGAADLTITDASLTGPAQAEEQPYSIGELFSTVALKLGRRGLTDEATRTIYDTGHAEAEENRYPLGRDIAELDCGDYGDPVTGDVALSQADALRRLNRLRYLLLCSRLPVYVARLRPVARVTSGCTVDATLSAVVGPDGAWGITAHRCVVIGAEMASETRVQTLRLLDLYPLMRATHYVAPSWLVAAVTSYTVFDVAPYQYSSGDVARWVTDAHYDLWSAAGVLRSTDGAVTGHATGGVGIELDAEWYAGGVKVTPAPGDVVRIASYDVAKSFGEWLTAAYIADAKAELGADSDAAHRWGW